MKQLTLAQKMWLIVCAAIIGTVSFSYALTHYFYEKYYVEKVDEGLRLEGLRLASNYSGGEVTAKLRDQIDWYNKMSDSEVFLVTNPRELSACLPFEVEYDSLISEQDRQQLLQGNPVTKSGFEERFGRTILSVSIPLLDDNRLQGILFLYIPLATIMEMNKELTSIFIPITLCFVFLSLALGRTLINRITQPLRRLESAAHEMAHGNYAERVPITTHDEIGKVGQAFNQMACAVAEEDKRKKEFLANVSHELRTPISYVKGYSEAILDGVVESEQDQRSYISLIHREAGRMQRLVHDLLELAKLENNAYPLAITHLVYAQLIEDVLMTYRHILVQQHITLEIDLDPELIIEADQNRIEQVLHNLLDNAIRYTPEQGTISIKLCASSHTPCCELSIRDTGIGIAPEHLPHITEPFYRANKARTRKDGGTGLGLAIVSNIVAMHGGTLTFHSIENEGTTVTIALPRYRET